MGSTEMEQETTKALVRRPGPRLAEGLVTHIERTQVDVDLAQRQWEAYVAALGEAGWQAIEVDQAPRLPRRGVHRGRRRGLRAYRRGHPPRGR